VTTLLLDASFFEGVIALANDGRIIKEVRVPLGPLVEEDLAERLAEMMNGVDRLALGVGPGSFTGMRVAAALLLPIAYARSLPLMTFSSLEGMAPVGELVAADAKRGHLYYLDKTVSMIKAEDLPRDRVVYSPHPLKKIYQILQDHTIGLAPFRSEILLPKLKERAIIDPLQVKLAYLQSV
jgi:tRNA A37 threonylcarbamoyladenosine modification protein TsaB